MEIVFSGLSANMLSTLLFKREDTGTSSRNDYFQHKNNKQPFWQDKCLLKKNTAHRIFFHTTRLPSSKLVVYLSVQKSRAAANVVGAYVWQKKNQISTKNKSRN